VAFSPVEGVGVGAVAFSPVQCIGVRSATLSPVVAFAVPFDIGGPSVAALSRHR
jgi:hypothetical protein